MRILIVCAESLTEGFAPAAYIEGVSEALRGLGHEVDVAGFDTGPYHQSALRHRLARYAKVNLQVLTKLGRYDAILSRGHFAHLPWAIGARIARKPVFHTMNGFIFDASTTHKMGLLPRAIVNGSYALQFRAADGIVCVTKEIANRIRERYPWKAIRTIPNGVDVTRFHPDAAPKMGRPYAVFPSSLAPWHGVDTILDAAEHEAWPQELDVVILGSGSQAEAVRARARINPRIRYLGVVKRAELAEIMRRASVGLCLINRIKERSVTEVYPLKLCEMMASGLPVVVTDLPGQRDIVRDSGAGAVIAERDPAALARAVADLLRREDRAEIGLAGSRYVADRCGWRTGAEALSDLMRDSIGQARTGAARA